MPCLLHCTNTTCLSSSSSELHHYTACLLSLGRIQRFLYSTETKQHICGQESQKRLVKQPLFSFFYFHPSVESAVHLTSTDKPVHSCSPEYLNDLLLPVIVLNRLMTKISYTGSCYATISHAELGEIISDVAALPLITQSIIFSLM